jgi:hypothetical protein
MEEEKGDIHRFSLRKGECPLYHALLLMLRNLLRPFFALHSLPSTE